MAVYSYETCLCSAAADSVLVVKSWLLIQMSHNYQSPPNGIMDDPTKKMGFDLFLSERSQSDL